MMRAEAPAGNSHAIGLMILAILCFTLMDSGAKALAPKIGLVPTIWVRYAGHMAMVLAIIGPRLRVVAHARYPRLQLLRSVLLMGATVSFFTGLSLIPLSDAAALMSVNPVLITVGAALFLGEALGPRRIVGVGISLLGAAIVLRPGSDVFSPAALLPLCAAACYAAYSLLTRRVGADEDAWTSLFYTGLVGTIVLTLALPFYWQTPDASAILPILTIVGAGVAGQLAMIRAFSMGEAAMLAPYSYCGLVFAALWGALFFGEFPDGWTILGALVIAAGGLYVWYRETSRN